MRFNTQIVFSRLSILVNNCNAPLIIGPFPDCFIDYITLSIAGGWEMEKTTGSAGKGGGAGPAIKARRAGEMGRVK